MDNLEVSLPYRRCFGSSAREVTWMPLNDIVCSSVLFVIISVDNKDKQKNINMLFNMSKMSVVTRVKQ